LAPPVCPQATAFGADAYDDVRDKGAALLHSLAFLGINGLRLTLTNDEAYQLILDVAAGRLDDVAAIAAALRAGSGVG
jgi:death-on-curing protein